MTGIFIPGITVEMFRNGCLEAIEALMAEGKIYAIEYNLKSAQPEHLVKESGDLVKDLVNDCINRQDAVKMMYDACEDIDHESLHIDVIVDALENLPSADVQPVVRCKDCKHKPHTSDKYDYDNGDCGFEIIFPDYCCPCRCEDEYYNYIPDDDWYCGNAQRG